MELKIKKKKEKIKIQKLVKLFFNKKKNIFKKKFIKN